MTNKSFFDRLLSLWFVWPLLFFFLCGGALVGLGRGSDLLTGFSVVGGLLSLLMMVVLFVVSLFRRRFLVAVLVFVSLLASLVLGVMGLVMGGMVTHPHVYVSPDMYEEDDTVYVEGVADTTAVSRQGK